MFKCSPCVKTNETKKSLQLFFNFTFQRSMRGYRGIGERNKERK